MIRELKTLAEQNGDRLEVISIDRIESMKNDLKELRNDPNLSRLQKSRITKCGSIKGIPDKTQSIIISAVPYFAAYVNLIFNRNGKEYKVFGFAPTYMETAKEYITETVINAGYSISDAGNNLPLKRVAVQSGLAEYGRNNLTYVKGLGSYLSYYAYYSDMPCEEDNWRKAVVSPLCKKCNFCLSNCPTGAITKDNFIINSEKCMRRINSDIQDFPEWLPQTAHHSLFGCLKCQGRCPNNAARKDVIDVYFDETETDIILGVVPFKNASDELKKKINMLWYIRKKSSIRNLRHLFDLMDKGYTPGL